MASLQMMNTGFARTRLRESNCFLVTELDCEGYHGKGKGVLRLPKLRRRNGNGYGYGHGIGRLHRVCCKFQDGDSQSKNNGEPPESLFMKELRRRGITPTSLLEESNRTEIDEEITEQMDDRPFSSRNTFTTGPDKSLTNQREQSMALNSEGLEGLIPRAKLLLTLGGTFFLAFWPLILITIAAFSALYLYFGPTFVHDGSNTPVAPPQYIDPYALLQDERISK